MRHTSSPIFFRPARPAARRIIAAGLLVLGLAAGAVWTLACPARPARPPALPSAAAIAIALHIWSHDFDLSLATDLPSSPTTPPSIIKPTPPAPTPAANTPAPAPATTATCPATIHISQTAPGSEVHVNCTRSVTGQSSGGTNVSISSSSNQTVTSGSSQSASNTSVTIVNQ
jgi:hypothetical protein